MLLLEPRIVRIALKQLDTYLHHSSRIIQKTTKNPGVLQLCHSTSSWGWETLVKSEKNLTWTLRQDGVFFSLTNMYPPWNSQKKHLKAWMVGRWLVSFWGPLPIFRGYLLVLDFRDCKLSHCHPPKKTHPLDVVLGVWMLGNTLDSLTSYCMWLWKIKSVFYLIFWHFMMPCTSKNNNNRSECDVCKITSEPALSCIRVIPLIVQDVWIAENGVVSNCQGMEILGCPAGT